eukprot:403332884
MVSKQTESASNLTSQNEEEKKEDQQKQLIKGMRSLEFKNIITDLQSKKVMWKDIEVPDIMVQNGLSEMDYSKPSQIQAHAIPKIMQNSSESYLFQAGNGSGKTGAFGIPAILRVNPNIQETQVIIFANTRELIRQIKGVLDRLATKMNISIEIGEGSIIKKAQILITSPNYFTNKLAGRGSNLDFRHVTMVVFDEADEIFKQENNREVIQSLIDKELKKRGVSPQYLIFSATFEQDIIDQFSKIVGEFTSFRVKKESLNLKGVKQYYIILDNNSKCQFVEEFYKKNSRVQAMLFTNTKATANYLKERLIKENHKPEIIIGGLPFNERDRIIDMFRETSCNALICTNVLARGIDVPEVDIVINFDVPITQDEGWKEPDYANYLHRVGRTGRFGTDGLALTLIEDDIDGFNISMIKKIEQHYGSEIKEVKSFEEFAEIYKTMRGGAEMSI